MKLISKASHVNNTLQIIPPILDEKSPIEGVVTCIRTSPYIKQGDVIFELVAIVFLKE